MGSTNKLVYMLSRPPTSNIAALVTLICMNPFIHDSYREACMEYEDFIEVLQQLHGQICVEQGDCKDD
jgi:hypothetical protein